ncbi:MAG: glutamine--fructose-6-phosphate transaminase (isomerizing) [Clostridiales bacterium]|nr:glutamine--fructose-6-phosphate transaminase (isomerizing) [Clostridiales bacterium]
MCGIIGFTGDNVPAVPILVDGLKKLEYRGYDSAGVAYFKDNKIEITKSKGRLTVLEDLLKTKKGTDGTVGIGHTRWATHGEPSDINSHPHISNSGLFAVVHNGIIENYATLKEELKEKGCNFLSDTDTEVIAHLLETSYDGDFISTVKKAASRLEGSYALGILCKENPGQIVCVRRSSPLIIGVGTDGNYIASDITAILTHTRKIYQLDDGEMALLTPKKVTIFDEDGKEIAKKVEKVTWDVAAAEKGGYEHFMIKEIMEQPHVLAETISPRIASDGSINLDGIDFTKEQLKKVNRIYILACGSAYHVGVVGKYVIEKLTSIPVEIDLASEFRYRNPLVDSNSMVIIISQSGETADTLAALREAKTKGARIISIVNTVGSSIARESDDVLYTWAGPEISVATTKAYSTQLSLVYLFAIYVANKLNKIGDAEVKKLLSELNALPDKISEILKLAPQIETLANRYAYLEHAYFIGRNLDYAVALEASLKLKEISYIHSEAYAAGELKHGTISLIEKGTFVVGLCCCERLVDKTVSNIREVKARGAEVLALAVEGNDAVAKEADRTLYIPSTHEIFMPSLEVVPMQLLGYYIAKARNCDIDKPRNLAKSVTVE